MQLLPLVQIAFRGWFIRCRNQIFKWLCSLPTRKLLARCGSVVGRGDIEGVHTPRAAAIWPIVSSALIRPEKAR